MPKSFRISANYSSYSEERVREVRRLFHNHFWCGHKGKNLTKEELLELANVLQSKDMSDQGFELFQWLWGNAFSSKEQVRNQKFRFV
jgi:hypothetical protein